MSDEPVIACTLGAANLAAQGRRWIELRRRAETGQFPTRAGKRIHFRADDGVAAELEQLVEIENECCAWADWSVEQRAGEVVVEVRSTGDGVAAARAMFSSAEP
jgi:hypothetical protein